MRQLAWGTLGLSLALPGSFAYAQDSHPAARLGGITAGPQTITPVGGVFRGQAPGSPTNPMGQPPVFGSPMPIQGETVAPPGSGMKPAIPAQGPVGTYQGGTGAYCNGWGTTAPGGTYAGPLPGQMPYQYNLPGLVPGDGCPAPDMLVGGHDGHRGLMSHAAVLEGGPRQKLWVSGEALMWWTKGATLPTLLSTSSPSFNGILGSGDTVPLLAGNQLGNNYHTGFRINAGYWFGCEHRWAVDATYFRLGTSTNSFTANSNEYPVLARPFVRLNPVQNFSQIIATPGLSTGAFMAETNTQLYGGDVNLRRYLAGNDCARADVLGGFRYLTLTDSLDITESFARSPNSNTGIGRRDATSGVVMDSFRTENNFYGGQFGLNGELRRGRWFTDLRGKIALGTMHSTVTIAGSQLFNTPSGPVAATGGLLALPGNIGTYTQSKFAIVPELNLNLGYHITPRMRVFVGYNVLYASSVLRAADQIDTGIDVTRIPNFPVSGATALGIVRPTPTLKDTDFWAQGINLGLQFTW